LKCYVVAIKYLTCSNYYLRITGAIVCACVSVRLSARVYICNNKLKSELRNNNNYK